MKKLKKKRTEEEKMELRKKIDRIVHNIGSIAGLGLIGWIIYSKIKEPSKEEKIKQCIENSAKETAEQFGWDYTITYDDNGKAFVDYYEK